MLHSDPASVKSADTLPSVCCTLLALYPGQSVSLLSGIERLHGMNTDHTKKTQVWKNVNETGMTKDRSTIWDDPLPWSHGWAI